MSFPLNPHYSHPRVPRIQAANKLQQRIHPSLSSARNKHREARLVRRCSCYKECPSSPSRATTRSSASKTAKLHSTTSSPPLPTPPSYTLKRMPLNSHLLYYPSHLSHLLLPTPPPLPLRPWNWTHAFHSSSSCRRNASASRTCSRHNLRTHCDRGTSTWSLSTRAVMA